MFSCDTLIVSLLAPPPSAVDALRSATVGAAALLLVFFVRSFLFQVSNNRLLKSNPKCIVEQTLVSDKTPPSVEFTFKNDHKWVFPASGRSDNEILMEVHINNTTGEPESDE